MNDLINRQDAIECCRNEWEEEVEERLRHLPSAQIPHFSRITIDTDGEGWLNRKLNVFKDRLYLNEKTMIVYVPFVALEVVCQSGGTFQRVGEEE